MLLVHQIRIPISKEPIEAVPLALEKLHLAPGQAIAAGLHKVSLDARRKPPVFVCSVAITLHEERQETILSDNYHAIQVSTHNMNSAIIRGKEPLIAPVIVVGLGPAGLFAALELARNGYAPIVLERGAEIKKRIDAVRIFNESGALDSDTNIQFGEGGAGTFSDGKLTTRINDPLCRQVLEAFVEGGADQDILLKAKPHIGTDQLRVVFENMRKLLHKLGVKIRFENRLESLVFEKNSVRYIRTNQGAVECGALVMATGHSARDTYTMLHSTSVEMRAKPFSVGYRIEHLQNTIDKGLYHEAAGHAALPPGEYQLSTKIDGRGVYTFCMCPGGRVVAAASEAGGVVTNGMSSHARDGANANAALVVGVNTQDYGEHPLDGVEFQRKIEKNAYISGGGGYMAPAQALRDYMEDNGKLSLGVVQPTYPRGVTGGKLSALLPGHLADSIRAAIPQFGRKLPGFDMADAVLTGIESRTSAPVCVVRGENGESVSHPGLYPCGEGAGYAGGIMSAAVDGIKTAHHIMRKYAPYEK